MTLSLANSLACGGIFAWAVWCIFSRRIRDGVVGKLFFIGVALTSLAVVFGPGYGYYQPPPVETMMNISLALVAIRHLLLVLGRPWWFRVKRRWILRCQQKK